MALSVVSGNLCHRQPLLNRKPFVSLKFQLSFLTPPFSLPKAISSVSIPEQREHWHGISFHLLLFRSGDGSRGRYVADTGAKHKEEALRGQLALVSLRRGHQQSFRRVRNSQSH